MKKGEQLFLWGPFWGTARAKEGNPRSQASDSLDYLTRKWPIWTGSECLVLGGMQADIEWPIGEGAGSEAEAWGGGMHQVSAAFYPLRGSELRAVPGFGPSP